MIFAAKRRLKLLALGLSLVSTLLAGTSLLQAEKPDEAATKLLSPHAQQLITRLGTLNQLPADGWRFHAGDLMHGESLTLDDSAWPIVKTDEKTPEDAGWFRRTIELPKTLNGYDLTGARIWFQFVAWANGPMPEIVYFNGRRVALGDDIEPIVLLDQAKPGDKILVAVKLLHTVDKKHFGGVRMKIDFAENRPNPEVLREEFLTTALALPSLSKNLAADQATLDAAIASVDQAALDAGDQAKFDASLKAAQNKLEALRPIVEQSRINLTGNAHIDAAWLWPWTETVDVVKRTFSTALQLMNEYPDYTFSQSAAAYNEWIATKYPEMNEQIKRRIKEGRWEIVGGMWVEPDLNMPDGEAQVRSLLVGKRWFAKEYGVDVRIGWNPDSFGYTWQLPQIYKRSGVDYFVTQKTAWNDTNQFPFRLFWWESPDGSKVLTYFPHDYANDNLNPVRLERDFTIAHDATPGLNDSLDLYGIGDHGGGPTRAILDEGDRWIANGKIAPKMHYGTAQSYFSEIEKKIVPESPVWNYDLIAKGYKLPAQPEAGKIAIPTWKDELYFEYHRGVMTTQATHKRNMRSSEVQTLNAEKLASLAWLGGDSYPAEALTDDWKKITFNDFHDLAAGSGIGVIYKEAQKDYDDVRWSTEEIDHAALKTLSASINTAGQGTPILVFNPLAWERSGTVTVDVQLASPATHGLSVVDATGKALPAQIVSQNEKTGSYKLLIAPGQIPSLGYKILHVVEGSKPTASDLKAEGLTLENARLKLTVDGKNGCITSLYDKQSHFESLAPGACGNQLQGFKDTPKDYDAWNIDPGTLDHFTAIEAVDSVELVEKGPMRAAIRVTRHWQSSKFTQLITLASASDQAEIINDIDWHETHLLLKAAFPLAATAAQATYEVPYGAINRPTTRNNSWEKAQFEVPALRWAELGDGKHALALINNDKYGYDDEGNQLRLSLLRSPIWPDPVADRGQQHISYALYPHVGDWKQALTVRHGYEYNYPLAALQVSLHSGELPAEHAYLTVAPENVVLTALKKAEDSDGLIFRVYEWAGKASKVTIHLPKGATSATVTNMMEKPEGEPIPVTNDAVTLPITPYQILTFCVSYPKQK